MALSEDMYKVLLSAYRYIFISHTLVVGIIFPHWPFVSTLAICVFSINPVVCLPVFPSVLHFYSITGVYSVLQIRWGNRDNLVIISCISP